MATLPPTLFLVYFLLFPTLLTVTAFKVGWITVGSHGGGGGGGGGGMGGAGNAKCCGSICGAKAHKRAERFEKNELDRKN